MPIVYISSLQPLDSTPLCAQPASEEAGYAARLLEVENILLCQALGGQLPQPDNHLRLQRYLNGEISRAEALQSAYPAAHHWVN